MNIQTDQLGNLHTLISITIEDADYRPKFDSALKELSKKVQMKGFRTGHTPPGMVKKMYGESVLADELNKMVNEQVGNYLKENNISLLGDALPMTDDKQIIDYNEIKPYKFIYQLGIRPEISFTDTFNKEKTFTRYKILAKDEEVQAELDRLQRKYGKRIDADEVEENDVVYAHIVEMNADATAKEGGINVETFFNTQMLNDDSKQLFIGAKPGELKNIADVFIVFKGEKDKIAKNIFQIAEPTEEIMLALSTAFDFTISKISRIEAAPIDDEFLKAVAPDYGEVSTEEELKANIKDGIEIYNSKMTEVNLDNEVYKSFEDTTKVPLPEVFLNKWYKKTEGKEDLTEEAFETDFNTFLTQLRQSLLFQKIQQEHNLKVTQDEIINEAIERVKMSYGNLGEDFVNYILSSQLKEKEFVENMHDRAMQRKFVDVLKQYITIEEKEITLEEFQNINKDEYAQ